MILAMSEMKLKNRKNVNFGAPFFMPTSKNKEITRKAGEGWLHEGTLGHETLVFEEIILEKMPWESNNSCGEGLKFIRNEIKMWK